MTASLIVMFIHFIYKHSMPEYPKIVPLTQSIIVTLSKLLAGHVEVESSCGRLI
jgi:hypothetical protein